MAAPPPAIRTRRFLFPWPRCLWGRRKATKKGRARPPEYVTLTTQIYRNAVAEIQAHTYTPERAAADKERLREVFNRDFWNGYYLGQRLGEWTN
ncbi:MAG: U32 family peptidase, partial [Desulfovibrio sp.]|nr:U32 family peptidase [Desulfovibrio sp.]